MSENITHATEDQSFWLKISSQISESQLDENLSRVALFLKVIAW
jgi:hypothetical protein